MRGHRDVCMTKLGLVFVVCVLFETISIHALGRSSKFGFFSPSSPRGAPLRGGAQNMAAANPCTKYDADVGGQNSDAQETQVVSSSGMRSYAPDLVVNGGDLPEGANRFEEEYVHDVYDTIAEHFSNTRYKPWPKVFSITQRLSLVLPRKPEHVSARLAEIGR